MVTPTSRPKAIVAVTGDDPSRAAVLKRAASLARVAGSTVILWDRDAAGSPLESPLPTEWSGDGEEEQFGDRLGPNDLMAAGREPLAKQVGELRSSGLQVWAWLPDTADAEHLAAYAADQHADLILVSADDADLLADLQDLGRHETPGAPHHLRVEAVPG